MTSKDPLLEKARKAEEGAERSRVAAAEVRKNAKNLLEKAFEALQEKIQNAPRVLSFFITPLFWIFKGLVIYLKWASFLRENGEFKRDEEGNLIFSRTRLVRSLLGTFLALFMINVAWAAAYFYGTQFEELVYTTGKQEIITGELYQFTGCTSLPCSTEAENGKFYEIEHSLFLPYLIYPEEDVYANIPQQDGACYAKGYGLYIKELKVLHRSAQWYQKIYSISCRPYTEQEKVKAIESGAVPKPPGLEE